MTARNTIGLLLLLNLVCLKSLGQTDLPPKLIYPNNEQIIQEAFPALSWTRAYPSNLAFTYEIKMVEMLPKQSPESAIVSNPEWYINRNLSRNLLMYPVTAPLLQKGKRYAWQVTAKHTQKTEQGDIVRVLPSEVFWFETAQAAEKKICLATPVIDNQANDLHYVLDDYVLRFKFEEEIFANKLEYQFLSSKHEPIILTRKIIPEHLKSANYYQIPLRQFKIFRKKTSKNKFYYLKASIPNGKAYYIKFTY